MAGTDLTVLVLIFAGTILAALLLRRRIRGRLLFDAVWLSFYGLVLILMMSAHSAEIVYRIVAARAAAGHPAGSMYDFRVYSLLLLGALLIWAGVACLRAARSLSRGSAGARRTALRVIMVVVAIVAPLIPIQRVFGILLTVLGLLAILVLKSGSPTSRPAPQ